MKFKTLFFLTFLTLVGSSCNQNYGNKLESEELDIYYADAKYENLAKSIGHYWKQNDFLGEKKQFIRLATEGELTVLQLVISNKADLQNLSFDERRLLLDLQDSLRSLPNAENLELVISDNNFNTLYNINQ